jgi:hypothetical protein
MNKKSLPAWRATSIALGVALLLSLIAWVSLDQSALAASEPLDATALITVETADPAINDDDLCSIIEAIENANFDALTHDDCEAGSGDDTIALPADATLIFTTAHNAVGGENALPVITSTITISGNNATLVRDTNVAPLFRFFNVAAEGSLTLSNLEMRNGRAGLTGTIQLLYGGGAIVNQGTLRVVNSSLNFNHASFGGAIYSEPLTGSLTLENTSFNSNTADFDGGALYNYGAGTLTGGTLRFNQAGSDGGAILHDSSDLTVTGTVVVDNLAGGTGAGIAARATVTDSQLAIRATNIISNAAQTNGGGIHNSAFHGLTSRVEVEESNVVGNRTVSTNTLEGIGGGVFNGWTGGNSGGVAEMEISQSSITDNVAQTGGGVANVDGTGYPTRTVAIVILQSTLARNTAAGVGSAQGSGGGLYNSNGTATVANSTISGNQAVGSDEDLGGRGGGIGSVGRGITTTLQLLNSTLAYNEATQAGGGLAVMGQVTTTETSVEVGNTLIVNNALTVTESVTNAFALAASPQVILGTESCSIEDGDVNTLGGNIEDGDTCGFGFAPDFDETPVLLGPLADNGGPTFTHLITQDSVAFNHGLNAICVAAPVNGVDQRGVSRPQGERCETGALEVIDEIAELYYPWVLLHHTFQ